MKVLLTDRIAEAECMWCQKQNECVTATFSDGLFKEGTPLCYKCLQTAIRVRSTAAKPSDDVPTTKKE